MTGQISLPPVSETVPSRATTSFPPGEEQRRGTSSTCETHSTRPVSVHGSRTSASTTYGTLSRAWPSGAVRAFQRYAHLSDDGLKKATAGVATILDRAAA